MVVVHRHTMVVVHRRTIMLLRNTTQTLDMDRFDLTPAPGCCTTFGAQTLKHYHPYLVTVRHLTVGQHLMHKL